MHKTVLSKGECEQYLKSCTSECPFCSYSSMPELMYYHIKNHFQWAVQHHDFTILKCSLKCRAKSHFHCCYCSATVITRANLLKHIATHASPPTQPRSSSVQQTSPQSSSVLQTPPQSSSVQQTPPQSSSIQQTPPQSSSVQQTPPQSSSVQQTPPQSSPVQQTPPQSSSVQQTPPQSSSVQQTPPQSSSVQQTPPQSSPVQQTPPQSSSVQQTPPQSSSIQQTPPQSSSVQQVLVQQTLPQSPAILLKFSAPKKRTVNCCQCDLTLLATNLPTHIKRHHTEKENANTPERHFQSQCIDEKIGIFAVEKAFLGQATPIHVIKNTWGPNYRSACELNQCILNAEFAHNTGILPFECCHVKSLSFCKLADNPNVALTENSLSQLVQQKWFGEGRKAQLLKLQQEANTAETPLSFHVTVGGPSTKHFLSVFEPTMSYYSRMGRVMVAYNKKKNNWHCPCARPRQSCIHKATAKWHLFQIMPQLFKRVKSSEEVFNSVHTCNDDASCQDVSYPPTLLLLKG